MKQPKTVSLPSETLSRLKTLAQQWRVSESVIVDWAICQMQETRPPSLQSSLAKPANEIRLDDMIEVSLVLFLTNNKQYTRSEVINLAVEGWLDGWNLSRVSEDQSEGEEDE